MILSWLTFQALLPVVEELGPTALVYPSLRGVPLLDRWLLGAFGEHDLKSAPELIHTADEKRSPCLPNRFLALVPWGPEGSQAAELARRCAKQAQAGWKRVCDAVRGCLKQQIESRVDEMLRGGWDRWWSHQVENFFDFRTAVLPWNECSDPELAEWLRGTSHFTGAFPAAAAVRALADAIAADQRPGWQRSAGQWQHRLELSARLMEAAKSVRHVPPSTPVSLTDEVPPKCSLLGSFEQMGPCGLNDSAEFWEQAARISVDGVRLRGRERLCAVALVKRFAGPCALWGELGLGSARDLLWDDTATIAAAEWLQSARIDHRRVREEHDNWSGQWLHWPSPKADDDEDECPDVVWTQIEKARRESKSKPPAYYAVLALDGDRLGDWLRGERLPNVGDIMHGKMVDYFKTVGGGASLNTRRHVGPALHAAISEALANFALHFVPLIVKKHFGTLIYAGGDDVLALLPTASALACARELRQTFSKDWKTDAQGRERLLMGGKATLSAGLAVVHYKEDLRLALEWARDAEKAAKHAGRDALVLAVCRRSGEHASALCPWEFVPTVERWVQAFRADGNVAGASDRWAYHLRQEVDTLAGLDSPAMLAEIRRQVARAEEPSRRRLSARGDAKTAPDEIAAGFDEYRRLERPHEDGVAPPRLRFENNGITLRQFITLCQSASFLARGRDE